MSDNIEEIEKYQVNRYVLKSPILIGLSQSYYFRFFIAVFIDIVLLPILVLIFDPLIGVSITLGLLAFYFFYLKYKRKKFGENPLELISYKKQEKEILIDNSRIFYDQAN